MIECALRDAVVAGMDVGGERGFEFCRCFEARLPDDLGNAAVESLDHAVGLRVTRGGASRCSISNPAQRLSKACLPGGGASLLAGLLRHRGLPASVASPAQLDFDTALSFGDVCALDQIWCELGFDALAGVFRKARFTTAVEHALRVMVFNRLCVADSKLGVLRWLQTVYMRQIDAAALTHQQLLRSMDALMDHHDDVDSVVAGLLRPLVDQDMSMVFYDLTTIRAAGLSEQLGDVHHYGMAKEGVIARQFMLGVVQTAEGLPIYHEVFDGNQAEGPTLLPTLRKVLSRFPHIRRLIVVADRGG